MTDTVLAPAEVPPAPPATDDARVDRLLAWGLFLFTVILVGLTSNSMGFTRDEGYYFKAAEEYFGWFRALATSWSHGDFSAPFTRAVIDRHWSYNHEHPVLMKTLFGLSWGILKEGLGLFTLNSTAFRFPAFLMAGLSVALTFLLARRFLGRAPSLLAALMWLSLPHAFWHMHLACFDIPVCAAHLLIIHAYVTGRDTVKGALWCGVAFGLGAAIKHNVLLTPALLVLHWLLTEARLPRREGAWLTLPPIPLAFFGMALVGPVVFLLHWPYLWPDVVERYSWYLGFHLNHEHYPILYFGDLLTHPPFPRAFVYVMTAVTAPVPVLCAFILGALLAAVVGARAVFARVMGGPAPADVTRVVLDPALPHGFGALLLLLNAALPFALWLPQTTPIFGGTKHWMNALPFLCILGAWAVQEGVTCAGHAWESLRSVATPRAFALLTACIIFPGLFITARVHPYGLGAYNELVGFARGAANTGFQRTFWGHEPRLVLPDINQRTRDRGSIHFGDTNYDDWRMYNRDGLLRRDIGFSQAVGGAAVASVQPQGEFKDQWMEVINLWNTQQPQDVVHLEGVPVLTVTYAP